MRKLLPALVMKQVFWVSAQMRKLALEKEVLIRARARMRKLLSCFAKGGVLRRARGCANCRFPSFRLIFEVFEACGRAKGGAEGE